MKKVLYIFLITHLSILSTIDLYSITWNRTYGQPFLLDYSSTIYNTGSGFYFVGGYAQLKDGFLIKIDEYGDTVWTGSYPKLFINTLIEDYERGCIIAGSSDSLRVSRIDSNGYTVWEKKYYQNFNFTEIRDIKKTSDSNFIACGYGQNGIVFKFDNNGNLFWLKMYPAKIFYSIDLTANEGYILTGLVQVNDTNKILILKMDSAGNIIWEKNFKVFNQPATGHYIKRINSQYFVAGETIDTSASTYNNRLYFIRVNENGELIFSKLFTYYKGDTYFASYVLNNNRYLFSSFTFSEPLLQDTSSYSKVILTDSTGNILASRNFYGDYYYGYNAITTANNSDILLSGSAKVPGSGEDFLVSRVDSLLYGPPIGITEISNGIPKNFVLCQNYPNPFNPFTKIKFDIPSSPLSFGEGTGVRLAIFDILGREITVLVNKELKPGSYEVEWNASNYPSGVYFYRITIVDASAPLSINFTETKKMVLIK